MNKELQEFGLKIKTMPVESTSACYRPSIWPPPPDWPVVIARDGKIVSRWSDPRWDFSPWAETTCSLNFGDSGKSNGKYIDPENRELLRQAIGYLIWGPDGAGAVSTIATKFSFLRRVFNFCSKQGINAANLMRFPKAIEELPSLMVASSWQPTLDIFHRLYDARDFLGFTVLNLDGLTRLARASTKYSPNQTPYIPPRIWTYQFLRLRECLDEFIAHQEKFEQFFKYCLDAYVTNFGSIEEALAHKKVSAKGPFTKRSELRRGCTYLGPFIENAAKFGVDRIISKWLGNGQAATRVSALSAYLSLVTFAGLAYIANLTLQRRDEVAHLRASCLLWEQDESLGRLAIICGQTTKTEDDSNARWAASPSVEVAVDALSSIARLRMLCDAKNPQVQPSKKDCEDPFLNSVSTEPWASGTGAYGIYSIRVPLDAMTAIISRYPLLFSEEELRITGEDLKIARQLTPGLCEKKFALGKAWPLAWHQYRRTGAVNMFASGVISDSSMQQQMKHLTLLQSAYYGQGHTRLQLNDEMKETIVAAFYEMNARRLQTVIHDRFVSPVSPERIVAMAVNIISSKDSKKLTNWAKAGKVAYRETRLGGCMKSGP